MSWIARALHNLYLKAGVIKRQRQEPQYPLRANSLRKYFRTQLGALNTIPIYYIEYMMGHSVRTYNDIKVRGVEFLMGLYALSGLSVRSRTKQSKIEQQKSYLKPGE